MPLLGVTRGWVLQLAWLWIVVPVAACRSAHGDPVDRAIDPTTTPEQVAEVDEPAFVLQQGDSTWSVAPLARYRIAARVLSRERYYLGWQSDLSPLDLALGWGQMADPSVDRSIDWYQGTRWYFFHWSASSPFHNQEISAQSANVHIVPATLNLRRALLALGRDQVIELSGELVRIKDGRGEHTWQSSLSRSDTGDGSCELMWVTQLVHDGRQYQSSAAGRRSATAIHAGRSSSGARALGVEHAHELAREVLGVLAVHEVAARHLHDLVAVGVARARAFVRRRREQVARA
jgi:hypothetical protein